MNSEIIDCLENLTLKELSMTGEWNEYLVKNYRSNVTRLIERESIKVDGSNTKELDFYLISTRRLGQNLPSYQSLLKVGIERAIKTENESLTETLCVVLGKDLIFYSELFKLAMKKYPDNKGIHRVLYNNFRESNSEIRGFVGNGNSPPY